MPEGSKGLQPRVLHKHKTGSLSPERVAPEKEADPRTEVYEWAAAGFERTHLLQMCCLCCSRMKPRQEAHSLQRSPVQARDNS